MTRNERRSEVGLGAVLDLAEPVPAGWKVTPYASAAVHVQTADYGLWHCMYREGDGWRVRGTTLAGQPTVVGAIAAYKRRQADGLRELGREDLAARLDAEAEALLVTIEGST
jgi:hypothetical protein